MYKNRKYITVFLTTAVIIAAIGAGFYVYTAGSKDKDANFEIYLVRESGSDTAQKTCIDKLALEDTPLITSKDIIEYNWDNHSFKVKNNGKINGSLLKRPFVVVADGERIYMGTFWSALYSMQPPEIPVYLDGMTGHDDEDVCLNIGRFTLNEKIPDNVLKTISDQRVYQSLKRLGILFEPAVMAGDGNSDTGTFGPLEKKGDLSPSDIPDTGMKTTELQENNPPGDMSMDVSKINDANYVTAVTVKCIAKRGPGDGYAVAAEVPAGRLVRVTGVYLGTNVWMRAVFVQGIEEKPDSTELWINSKNIVVNAFEPVDFNNCRADSAMEYTYVIKSEKGEHWEVGLKQMPGDESQVVAEARGGDLVRVLREPGGDTVKIVRDNTEWSLVQKISDGNMVDTSDVGWIKTGNYTPYKTGMKTNQGFLSNGAVIFDAPGNNAGILYKITGLAQIFIVKSEGDWTNVNGGFNTFNGWVKTKDIKYCLAGEDPYKLANPEINKKEFAQKIKEEIKNWKNIKLYAQDINKEITLSEGQKAALSDKLTSIGNIESFDGGYSLAREAVYPFYTLELQDESGNGSSAAGNYTFTVAGDDKLLVEIPSDRLENYYGISKNRVPVRYLTVNKEFISYISNLLPPPENNNKNDWNYLLNAGKVIAGNVEGDNPQQVYKCARAVRAAAGSEIEKADIPGGAKEISSFKFLFGDGSSANVSITDKYILYNGRYYTEKINPDSILASLFAGYF